jgi:hypothetical protein
VDLLDYGADPNLVDWNEVTNQEIRDLVSYYDIPKEPADY